MKKVIIILSTLLAMVGCATIGPVTGEVASEVVEVEGVSKDDLYIRANSWAVDVFVSAESVIEFQDKEAGIIKGKYWFTTMSGISFHDVQTTLTVEVRDGRARILLSDPLMRTTGNAFGSSDVPAPYRPLDSQAVLDVSRAKWETLINDFRDAMRKQSADW